MAAKLKGNQASEQGRRIQLTDDRFHIGERADDGMNRDDITKADGRQRHKAEIDESAIGLPTRAARDISEAFGIKFQINAYMVPNISPMFK